MRLRFNMRPRGRRVLAAMGLVVVGLALLRLWPHPPLSARIPISTAVWSADGELLRVTLASDDQYRLWTPLSEMSPDLVQAFLVKEDRWFYWHPGVNPISFARAAYRTYTGGKRQGGSTLTMQLVRIMEHRNTRRVSGKLHQAISAIWLEARYSKRELLEAYLNVAPFGGNVGGVGAASRIYFGKPPAQITLSEALTLAVIPQNPAARAGRGRTEAGLLAARTQLGSQWLQSRGGVSVDAERRQIEIPLVIDSRFSMPYEAPHFVDAVLASQSRRSGRVDTTIDASLQHLVERQIDRYLEQYGSKGIQNVSALIVDSRDMAVKAWVGSANYWNEAIDGQVNGVLAKRSPGSTLKPFIYALALDQGILHPRTMLRDAPTAFGPYSPENFDGQFFGPVSAEEALIRSRNIPAMVVASQLKQPSLYQFLKNAGVSRLQSEAHYGLALVLGGGEVSMEELAEMYAMLANHGTLQRLRITPSQHPDEGVPLISPEASFITLDMLSHNPRPDEDGAAAARSRWPVAWKTGTSWGFRDAWSAGVVGPYVLVVWIGNFEGQGNPSFIGVDAAAPLFFRIVDDLNWKRAGESIPMWTPPKGVSRVAVCTASGDLPNAWCPQTVETWYIPGRSPIRVSQLHRPVAIDPLSGRVACPPYPAGTSFQVFELWPSDMLKLFREAGMPRRVPPSLPDCAQDDPADAPRISSPLRGVSYTLHRNGKKEYIELDAGVAGDVRTVFWFDGRALIGRVAVQQGVLQWIPDSEGIHLLRVIDDHGRSTEREVHVQFTR